jgi:hypothetical protein
MTARVLHHPRVAWDATTVIVHVAERPGSDVFWWYIERLSEVLGISHRVAFTETVERMATSQRPDQVDIESARWRARLSDVLGVNPDLAEDLNLLTMHARARLAEIA